MTKDRGHLYWDTFFGRIFFRTYLLRVGKLAKDERAWFSIVKRYRSEMSRPVNSRALDLLAALSHRMNFSVGYYCSEEQRCHRSVLRQLLAERGVALI